MKKIIVRNKILSHGRVSSSYINLCDGMHYSSSEKFIMKHGFKNIMKALYGEEFESDLMENATLYQSYCAAVDSQKDNDYFLCLYQIDEDFAVHLTGNIYLYHLIPHKEEVYTSIVPWFYADSKKYIGDTWWESDIEIINNLKSISIVEFLKRYKGY